MLEELFTLLFPEHCVGCDKVGQALCATCGGRIAGRPRALDENTASLFDYQNPLVKKALWALKYHHRRSLGKYFGVALYREFFSSLARGGTRAEKEILLIPIPGGRSALARRGYNHASVIATTIARSAKMDGLTLHVESDILIKKRENKQQVEERTKEKRAQNVAGVFGVKHGERITGKTVVLIDDIVTTGATIKDARRALRAWKPKRILAVVVAH